MDMGGAQYARAHIYAKILYMHCAHALISLLIQWVWHVEKDQRSPRAEGVSEKVFGTSQATVRR